jgi:hypothetical protein
MATHAPFGRDLAVGQPVNVRCRFDGRWVSGFDVAELLDAGQPQPLLRLRRRSDGVVLPATFKHTDVSYDGDDA